MIGIIVALFISIALESSVTSLPLTLMIILFAAITTRNSSIYFLAFFAGLILDILTLRSIGWSSLIFVTLVYFVFAYEKKFEIDSLHFIFFTSIVASLIYSFLRGLPFPIFDAIFACLISTISYMVFGRFNRKQPSYANG